MTLLEVSLFSQPFIAAGTIIGATMTVWIAFLVYRWSKATDKVQHIRLVDELWQRVNLTVIENPSLQALEVKHHPFGTLTEEEIKYLHFHLLKLNVAYTVWTFKEAKTVDRARAETTLRNYCNTTYKDRTFIETHVLTRGYQSLFQKEICKRWDKIDKNGWLTMP